jgi:hypothetical protein
MANDPYSFRLSPEEEAALEEEWADEQAARYPTPLPVDGDQLLKIDPDHQRTAMQHTFRAEMTYINGYMWAAEAVFNRAQVREQHSPSSLLLEHWLVYPLYFLYRHAVELGLKDILRTAIATLTEKQRKSINTTHDVYELWEAAKPWVMSFAHNELKDHTAAFESMLKQIQTYDPNAEAGRYHMSKVGKDKKARRLVVTFEGLSPLDMKAIHFNSIKILNYIRTIWSVYAEMEQANAAMLKPPDIEAFMARWLKEEEG